MGGICEKCHMDTMLANKAVHIFNNNLMMHFMKNFNSDKNNSHWTSFWLKKLGKQLQRKKIQL